jgi:hypothetical protein
MTISRLMRSYSQQAQRLKKIIAVVSIVIVASLVTNPSLAAYAENLSYRPNIMINQANSVNWSGYVVENTLSSPTSGFVHSVSGKWTVPTLTCSGTNTYSSMWVGMDGFSPTDPTVEQTGTQSDCRGTASK